MRRADELTKRELIDLLVKSWMAHDGMWFYNTYLDSGIEKANKINKAAIQSLASFEIGWAKKAFGVTKERFENFEELKEFFTSARELFIPPFMNASATFPRENVIHWEFLPKKCFAYRGISRIGIIEQYECGVVYRLQCWFESLGLDFTVTPEISRCAMIDNDICGGDFEFFFS